MFKISSRIRRHVTSRVVRGGGVGWRCQTSQAGGGGSSPVGKGLVVVAGGSTFLASLVGYAAWSDNNRKGVEKVIPGSSYVLSALLGPMVEVPQVVPSPPKVDQGLLKKKLDREKKKQSKVEESTPAPLVEGAKQSDAVLDAPTAEDSGEQQQQQQEDIGAAPELSLESPPAPEPEQPPVTPAAAVADDAKKPTAISSLEERLASSEVTQDVENAALTQALQELAQLAQKEITGALSAAEDAARVVQRHAESAYQAIDRVHDKEQFEAVAELAKERNELVEDANQRIAAASEAVEKFKDQISLGQSTSLTKEHPALLAAEEALVEMKYALERTKGVILEAERDSRIVSSYKELVQAGKEQFEAEVRSLLPEVKLGETSDKLTTDELNLLLAHAHRKVLHLQTQLARLQAEQETMEHDRFKEALVRQRAEDGHLLEAKVETELERQRQQLEVEYKKRVMDMKDDLEGELRSQLKRQAAAHSDHLADVLYVQEKELENKWSSILQDKVQSEKDTYLSSLARIKGQLDGLRSALSQRADVDKAALSARELWLACESLRNALRNAGDGAPSWEEQLKPLQDQIAAIRKAAGGGGNAYVEAVLKSLSEEAEQRGVYPEEALRERFIKVERVCKRVSMIGDNGGSLLRYLLSYIQSFLVLDAFEYMPGSEVRNEEVAVDSLSTYDILARARYCLEKDDLCMSVRYMNLLRGEPRNVAAGWLKEARLTLETRQAAYALLAHAAAIAVQAL